MELPIVEVPYIFHVGDLDASRPQRRASNEGCLLSVSIYPKEWTEILNIKQGTTYQLQPADGAPLRLLDAKSIDEETKAVLLDRPQEEGLLTKATMWKSYVPDDIDNSARLCQCITLVSFANSLIFFRRGAHDYATSPTFSLTSSRIHAP